MSNDNCNNDDKHEEQLVAELADLERQIHAQFLHVRLIENMVDTVTLMVSEGLEFLSIVTLFQVQFGIEKEEIAVARVCDVFESEGLTIPDEYREFCGIPGVWADL